MTEGRGRADDDSLKAVAPLWYGFALAGLIGIFTIIGFELAANLSEEAVNARLTVPKAVIYSVITAMTFGFIALVGFTMALPDVKSPDPIGTVAFWVGTFWTKVFLELVITSIFALTVVVTGGAARLVYALARDNMLLPAHWGHRPSEGRGRPVDFILGGTGVCWSLTARPRLLCRRALNRPRRQSALLFPGGTSPLPGSG